MIRKLLHPTLWSYSSLELFLTSNPFLLNTTVQYHLEKFKSVDPIFVERFLCSIYVDDLTTCASSEDEVYEFYIKSKLEAGFSLRKFASNLPILWEMIKEIEGSPEPPARAETQPVLRVLWDPVDDQLIFGIWEVTEMMLTKRNIISCIARVYDPLVLLSPLTIYLKAFFQWLCKVKIKWNECLTEELLADW